MVSIPDSDSVCRGSTPFVPAIYGRVAKLAYAAGLEPVGPKNPCRFDSYHAHQFMGCIMVRGDYGLYYGIECHEGWAKLYLPLIKRIQNEGGKLLQVKEKFGGLRIYASGITDELWREIHDAEDQSYHICEECGEPGTRGQYGSYWIKTLCPTHQELRVKEYTNT